MTVLDASAATVDVLADFGAPLSIMNAYPLGAKVTHKTRHWTSTVAANVWEPGSVGSGSLWSDQGPA